MGEISDVRFDLIAFKDKTNPRLAALEDRYERIAREVEELWQQVEALRRATAAAFRGSIVYK